MAVSLLDFDRIAKTVCGAVPRFSSDEQRLGHALYHELAAGEPVRRERLAERLGVATRRVVDLLEGDDLRCLTHYNEHRSIIGFGGLAVVPMHHQLVVAGRTLYAWCAWDTLFIPEMLQTRVEAASDCPQTGETIRLSVGPDGIEDPSHPHARVSFLPPEADLFQGPAEQTMASFCHFVFFFASPDAGEAWTAHHDGACLLTLDQAFELGRRKNAVQFPDIFRLRST